LCFVGAGTELERGFPSGRVLGCDPSRGGGGGGGFISKFRVGVATQGGRWCLMCSLGVSKPNRIGQWVPGTGCMKRLDET